ncbi:MAG: penicillin-binding protein 1A [Thermodesulfobacteriota bacterium]
MQENENGAPKATAPRKKSLFLRLIKLSVILGLLAVFCVCAAGIGVYFYYSRDLPDINSLRSYHPPTVTTVYAADGTVIAEFFKERRFVIDLDKMPKALVQAFIAAEDARFYEHQGLDFWGIVRAAVKNIEAGSITQGGSTITQQVTKAFLLTPERKFSRKIREAILAYRIDKAFTKDEILFLYLNQIYLGQGAYGVEAAAQTYFSKSASNLSLAECALLAGLPQAPSRYSPVNHPEKARERQVYVLNRMVEVGDITPEERNEALQEKLTFSARLNPYFVQMPYYTEHVRRLLEQRFGEAALYSEGFNVYTAADLHLQNLAAEALRKGLSDLDKRTGFRGPIEHLAPAKIEEFCRAVDQQLTENGGLVKGKPVKAVVVSVSDEKKNVLLRIGRQKGILDIADMRWARKPNADLAYYEDRVNEPSQALSVGDVVWVVPKQEPGNGPAAVPVALEQVPDVQGALLCEEVGTGLVKAMVGGFDFTQSQFNRAIQALRQPGSAFKPIVYSAALDRPENPYTPASVIIDSPIVYSDGSLDQVWKPKNYKNTFYGPTLLRDALAHSRNVVTVKILQDIGPDYCIAYARNFGITSPLVNNLSLALGSSELSLLEVVQAYSVFADQGRLNEPCFITKICDRQGKVLFENKPETRQVISPATAFVMTRLLEGVVERGTGWRIRALKRPVAGKTGTTNNLNDAWFVGYTPELCTGVWVGYDSGDQLGKGETGARAASPIFLEFMQRALADAPVEDFPVPEGVTVATIDADTGLLAIPESTKIFTEYFKLGTEPTEFAPAPGAEADQEQLFKEDLEPSEASPEAAPPAAARPDDAAPDEEGPDEKDEF